MSQAQPCCCIQCGKLYVPNRHGRQIYCSLACSAAAKAKRLLRKECPSCHEQFFYRNNARPIYCSTDCRDEGMTRA